MTSYTVAPHFVSLLFQNCPLHDQINQIYGSLAGAILIDDQTLIFASAWQLLISLQNSLVMYLSDELTVSKGDRSLMWIQKLN